MKKYKTVIQLEIESDSKISLENFSLLDSSNKVKSGEFEGYYKIISTKEILIKEEKLVIKEMSLI
jgi:hypothetical protein